jgi:hypothetical protein
LFIDIEKKDRAKNKHLVSNSVVNLDPDSQGSVTFAGSVTRVFRIRVHILKCM